MSSNDTLQEIVSKWEDTTESANTSEVKQDTVIKSDDTVEIATKIGDLKEVMQDNSIAIAGNTLKDKDIFEVNCGRGAGVVWYVEKSSRYSYIGLDASKPFPFPDQFFQIVLFVETTHTYSATKAVRVLRPNDYLLWFDTCNVDQTSSFIEYLTDEGDLIIEEKVNITKNDLGAFNIRSEPRAEIIDQIISLDQCTSFLAFAAIHSSPTYEDLRDERIIYWRIVLTKK
ncbi:unnamed protein product [Adineta steineri]|uniref:Methyltransferase type 11 domain-containing protein n=1 Tax=Adineta steineri TaxID=433720 RepID=A0A814DSX7_9BILA|nr:unnamed protein product [Adineta steineri]CAF3512887.1 unnamed protein product [Adineta steineri]